MYRILLSAVSIILLLAACAGAGAGATTAPVITTAPATSAPATSAATGATVSVASAGHFAGPNGMTLYTFDKDSLDKSVCTADCLANWPVLTVASAGAITVGTGLTAADFATITRDDGSLQVTFKQIPLYFFAGDRAAGDVNGDGVGGVWHLATTQSTLPPPASPPASAPAASTAAVASCDSEDVYAYCDEETSAPAASERVASDVGVSLSASGLFLVDAAGMSLYVLDDDPPGEATCTGGCANNWPALTVADENEQATAGEGVSGAFAVIEPAAGVYQVTYNDKPLYFYVGDSAPGDSTGDGLGDVWHLAVP